jgi:hypothetical protein
LVLWGPALGFWDLKPDILIGIFSVFFLFCLDHPESVDQPTLATNERWKQSFIPMLMMVAEHQHAMVGCRWLVKVDG